jgi:hypothetical protein
MDYVRQIEALVSIIIQSFEMQINTLKVFGGHRMRSDIVHHNMQLVQALLVSIESIERELTDEIEGEAEQVLGHSATFVNVLHEAKKEMPEIQVLKQLCNEAKNSHGCFTASLAKEEERITSELSGRFDLMKKRVRALLSRLEQM